MPDRCGGGIGQCFRCRQDCRLGCSVAVFIGNAGYKVGPLQNPGNDAAAVAEALEKLGFDEVILRRDLSFATLRSA